MLGLDLKLDGELEYLEAQLLISQPQILKAVDRALRKLTAWIERHSKRELGKVLKVPARVLSVRFFRSFLLQGSKREVHVWFGLNPIRYSQIGSLRQTSKGVRVGKHFLQGAFVAQMKSGHRGVFLRDRSSRHEKRPDGQWTELPINEQMLEIEEEASRTLERFYQRAESRFKELLRQELNYVIHHENN